MITRVDIAKAVTKALRKLPKSIKDNFLFWMQRVRDEGLEKVRETPGYHDEPIDAGPHAGQRSVRLNRAYRMFYVIKTDETGEQKVEFVFVEEINKHEYNR